MNRAVDAGILDLAEAGRLSGTSVLVDGPAAAADMPALLATRLQIGLHLNFTQHFGQPGPCLPLARLIGTAYLRRLPRQQVLASIERQLERFQVLAGRVPDYVDGHQHVHQLPQIRDVLVHALGSIPGTRPWVRDTSQPRSHGLPLRQRLKAQVIAQLGAGALRKLLQAQGYRHNTGFLGVYDFRGGATAYEGWLRCWLAQCRTGDTLMCHPAHGADPDDLLSAQRQAEFSVLAGAPLTQLLQEYRLIIVGADPSEEHA